MRWHTAEQQMRDPKLAYLWHSSAKDYTGSRRKHAKRTKLESAMSEVHRNIPSTVKRARVSGKRKEAMLRAIAFSKARKAGAKIPKR